MQNPSKDTGASAPPAALSELAAFWPFIRPYRGRIAVAAVILVSVSFILLSLGRGLAWLVDKGLGRQPVMLDRAVMVALSLALIVGAWLLFTYSIGQSGSRTGNGRYSPGHL